MGWVDSKFRLESDVEKAVHVVSIAVAQSCVQLKGHRCNGNLGNIMTSLSGISALRCSKGCSGRKEAPCSYGGRIYLLMSFCVSAL